MSNRKPNADPQSVFCEVCAKPVPQAEALVNEGRDHVAYFCSSACYERWQGPRAQQPSASLDIQEGAGRSKSRDELSGCLRELVLVPGATHLFEEPGTLDQVAQLAANWFARHLR